jgi:hypothetical protein
MGDSIGCAKRVEAAAGDVLDVDPGDRLQLVHDGRKATPALHGQPLEGAGRRRLAEGGEQSRRRARCLGARIGAFDHGDTRARPAQLEGDAAADDAPTHDQNRRGAHGLSLMLR